MRKVIKPCKMKPVEIDILSELPKTLQKLQRSPRVRAVWDEGPFDESDHYYWVELEDGWLDSESGCHTINGLTVTEIMERMAFVGKE